MVPEFKHINEIGQTFSHLSGQVLHGIRKSRKKQDFLHEKGTAFRQCLNGID